MSNSGSNRYINPSQLNESSQKSFRGGVEDLATAYQGAMNGVLTLATRVYNYANGSQESKFFGGNRVTPKTPQDMQAASQTQDLLGGMRNTMDGAMYKSGMTPQPQAQVQPQAAATSQGLRANVRTAAPNNDTREPANTSESPANSFRPT